MAICSERASVSNNEQGEAYSLMQTIERLLLELASIDDRVESRESNLCKRRQIMEEIGSAACHYFADEDDNNEPEDDHNSGDDNCSMIHYTDEDDDGQSYFRCTCCDFEIEVPILGSHVEEEHCFDLKNVVCPVCEEIVGKDAIRHLTQQLSSRKGTCKSEKSGIWSGNSAMHGKKLAGRGAKHEPMPDPLLSPFVCKVSVPNPNGIHPDEDSSTNTSDISDSISSGTDALDMVDEQDHQERSLRADFVQQLVLSTIY